MKCHTEKRAQKGRFAVKQTVAGNSMAGHFYTKSINGSFLQVPCHVFPLHIFFFSYYIQHCFICRPSDSTVPTDAGIEPMTVATSALAVRRSNH
jgi:hypothetical protein